MVRNEIVRGIFVMSGRGIKGRAARASRTAKPAMPMMPSRNHQTTKGDLQPLLAPRLKPTRIDG